MTTARTSWTIRNLVVGNPREALVVRRRSMAEVIRARFAALRPSPFLTGLGRRSYSTEERVLARLRTLALRVLVMREATLDRFSELSASLADE